VTQHLQVQRSLEVGGIPVSSIANQAASLVGSYFHKAGPHVVVDYKYDAPTNKFQFHIFPRVPDYETFLPDNQTFAKAMEGAVIEVLGKSVQVDAEFHEEEGVSPSGHRLDTRVMAYWRDPSGAIQYFRGSNGRMTDRKHKNPVPMVWFSVGTGAILLDPNLVLERIAGAIVARAEKLAGKP